MTKVNILIVEDEGIIARDVKHTLEELGYSVPAIAFSGEEAIKKAGEILPDLVLMDIVLRGAIDGVKAAEQIRARFNIPVVFLTAYADDDTLQRAKITAPFGYLLKPFREKELYAAIEIALHIHKMERKIIESEEWLSTILKSIGDAVIVTDTGGCVTFMNSVAEGLTGWKREDAARKHLKDIFNIVNEETGQHDEDPATRVLREGVVVGLANHTVLIARDGTRRPIDDSASPIRDNKGNITGVVLIFRDVTERKRLEEELRALSLIDELTSLYNRRGFFNLAQQQLKLAKRTKKGLLFFIADLDGLKQINDTYGHEKGDMALIEAAGIMKETFRESDIIGRIGGDEFAGVMLEDSNASAGILATRFQENLDAHNAKSTRPYKLSISIGIAHCDPEASPSIDELLKKADKLMYEQKRNKRENRF